MPAGCTMYEYWAASQGISMLRRHYAHCSTTRAYVIVYLSVWIRVDVYQSTSDNDSHFRLLNIILR